MDNSQKKDICCEHTDKIQYVCLESSCEIDRLLCRACLLNRHHKHMVGRIDVLIEPMNRLSINSNFADSSQNSIFFSNKVQIVQKEWKKLENIVNKFALKLKNSLLFQLQAISNTFSDLQVNEAYNIFTAKEKNIQQINKFVQKINFLQINNLKNVAFMRKIVNETSKYAQLVINKTINKITQILTKMQQKLSKINFNLQENELKQISQINILNNKKQKKIINNKIQIKQLKSNNLINQIHNEEQKKQIIINPLTKYLQSKYQQLDQSKIIKRPFQKYQPQTAQH